MSLYYYSCNRFAAGLVIVFLTLLIGYLVHRNIQLDRRVSSEQIYGLGDHPTLDDVIKLLGGMPVTDNLILDASAADGPGVYVFVFFPTKEVPDFPCKTATVLPLTAVVKADSRDAFSRGEGSYVWPKCVRGTRCTGFVDFEVLNPILETTGTKTQDGSN